MSAKINTPMNPLTRFKWFPTSFLRQPNWHFMKSIELFKSEATKHHTQYQRMIRRLLDAYVDGQTPTRQSTPTLRDKAAPRIRAQPTRGGPIPIGRLSSGNTTEQSSMHHLLFDTPCDAHL
ncbi:MAG: hypothetical protein M0Z26_04685 [Acidithiobacillus sp.]|nr:hypothetical protein [Acidithiobacillus sp.]